MGRRSKAEIEADRMRGALAEVVRKLEVLDEERHILIGLRDSWTEWLRRHDSESSPAAGAQR